MKVLVIISVDDAQLGQPTAVLSLREGQDVNDVFYEWLLSKEPYWRDKSREEALGAPYAWNAVEVESEILTNPCREYMKWREEIESLHSENNWLREEWYSQQTRADKLTVAVKDYGRHLTICDLRDGHGDKCSCGFEEVLAEVTPVQIAREVPVYPKSEEFDITDEEYALATNAMFEEVATLHKVAESGI